MALYILYTRVLVLHMLIWSSSSSVSKPLQVLNSTSHPNSPEVMPSVSSFSDSTSYGTCITESSFQLSIFNIHTHCVHGSASCWSMEIYGWTWAQVVVTAYPWKRNIHGYVCGYLSIFLQIAPLGLKSIILKAEINNKHTK